MRKLVFVNQYCTQLFVEKVEAFEQSGYEVLLFTGNTDLWQKKNGKVIRSFGYNRTNIITRIFSWLLFTIHFYFYVLFNWGKTYVITTNPPIIFWVLFILNKLNGLSYYLIIYDIYPDALVAMGYYSRKHLFITLWERINRKVYDNSKGIFTISQSMANDIKSKTTASVKLVHNWFDKSFQLISKEDNWFAKKYDLIDKKVIMYSGNLGITHNVEVLIELASVLKDDNTFRFIIIGNGAKKKELDLEAKRRGLNNLILLPFQPHKNLQYTLSSADLGVVTLDERAQHVSVPSKTYYLMAAGCALFCIGSKKSELGRLVDLYKHGVIFESNEINKMVKFLKGLTNEDLITYKTRSIRASNSFTSRNAEIYVNFVKKNGL